VHLGVHNQVDQILISVAQVERIIASDEIRSSIQRS
jgi:hypothetical protein